MLIELTPEEFKQAIEEYLEKHYNMDVEELVFPELTVEDYFIKGKPKGKKIGVEILIDTDDDAYITNDQYPELEGYYIHFYVEGSKDKVKEKLLDIFNHFKVKAETSAVTDGEKILKDYTPETQKYFEKHLQRMKNTIKNERFNYSEGGNQTFRINIFDPNEEEEATVFHV
jgi:hypothetical protein